MSHSHQLAAIVFADIVGYTSMMQQDESSAVETIGRFRKIMETTSAFHQGTIVQYYGDGCLLLFHSSMNAVFFSKQLQHELKQTPAIPVRVGIHTGDVLVNDGNVFGDVVNMASRIQALAPAGSIYVSETVHENTKNKKEAGSRFIEKAALKNIQAPVAIYEIITEDEQPSYALFNHHSNGVDRDSNSIAVLPFLNISGDPEQDYFSEGMADDIINSLTHLRDLKVSGRISSAHMKNENKSVQELGRKLGVRAILEGSIRKQGSRIRITAQLVNVEDGFHLWSEKFDREMNDIFAIQDEIALSITEKLKLVLLRKDQEKIARSRSQNTEAYDLYLKGRFHLNRRGASIVAAIQYFQNAMLLDPEFALAFTGYADAHLLLGNYGLAHPHVIMPKAKEAAEKAVQLDPLLAEPYCSLGFYYTLYERNWKEAKRNFQLSLELNPSYAQAHSWYGWNYLTMVEGKFDEGEKHGEMLIRLEPLNSSFYGTFSLILYSIGKLNKALDICRSGLELENNSFLCLISEGNILFDLEFYNESIAAFEKALPISNRHHFPVNGLIWNYCRCGEFERARILMDELQARSKKEYIAKTFVAISQAYLGNFDECFALLDQALEDCDPILLNIKYEKWGPPAFREDPRLQKLFAKIGYP